MIGGHIFYSIYENQIIIVHAFLKALKAKVTLNTIDHVLQDHPDYPSFLSITDSLKKWNINCLALETDEDKISSIPTPFITSYKNGQFILVNKLLEDKIIITNQLGKKEQINLNKFTNSWSKAVIVAETTEQSGEKNYYGKIHKTIFQFLLISTIVFGIFGSILVPYLNGIVSLIPTLYILSKIIGLGVSLLLLWHEIDEGNPLLKQICSGLRQDSNCKAILNSNASSIMGIISWSEVGFFYFTSALLFSTFSGVINAFALLSIFSLLVSPYIIFSIFYQWKIAKQWCLLCLGIQTVLFSELILTLINKPYLYSHLDNIIIQNIPALVASVIIPVSVWYLLKPIFKLNQTGKYVKRNYLQLKFNEQVFSSILRKQSTIQGSPTSGLGITIGNPNASKTIVKVCNPFCGPCAKAHHDLEILLKANNSIKVQIIFTVSNDEKDIGFKPVQHFLAIASKGDYQLTKQALEDWYLAPYKNYDAFAKKYPINGELNTHSLEVDKMKKWCEKVKISYTPTIFYDGYELPKNYQLKDLNYFI